MSPNFVCVLLIIACLVIMTKSFIVASAWVAVPTVWYLGLGYDIKIATAALIVAAVYSQLVIVYRGRTDVSRPSKAVRGR